jgi:hypothetical protein
MDGILPYYVLKYSLEFLHCIALAAFEIIFGIILQTLGIITKGQTKIQLFAIYVADGPKSYLDPRTTLIITLHCTGPFSIQPLSQFY